MTNKKFKQLFSDVLCVYGEQPILLGGVLEKINKEKGYVLAIHLSNDLLCKWGVCGFNDSIQDIVINAVSNKDNRDPYFANPCPPEFYNLLFL